MLKVSLVSFAALSSIVYRKDNESFNLFSTECPKCIVPEYIFAQTTILIKMWLPIGVFLVWPRINGNILL